MAIISAVSDAGHVVEVVDPTGDGAAITSAVSAADAATAALAVEAVTGTSAEVVASAATRVVIATTLS